MRSTGTVTGAIAAMAMILAGGLTAMAWAQDTGEQPPAVVMGEVVVTASRQAEAVTRVPAHVTVITSADIGRTTAQTIPDVLSTIGVHVSDISGNKRSYSVDLRGFGENSQANVLVLVDGRRINQADLSGTDWTLIPLDRVERIEVIRGSRGSVLYGDNATSGVINIITTQASWLAGSVGAQYGSYDTFKSTLGFSGAASILSYDLHASYLTSDGYRDNGDTEAKDIGANFAIDPHEKISIHLSGGYHKDKTGLPGALLQSELDAGTPRRHTNTPDDVSNTEDYYAKAGTEIQFLTDDALAFDVSYRNRSVDQYANFAGGWFDGKADIDTVMFSPRLTFQERFGEVSNRIILGIDYSIADQGITNISDFYGDISSARYKLEKSNIGYYFHDELGITRNLSLSGGYRHDRATFDVRGNGVNFAGPFEVDSDRTFKEDAYTLGINYTLGNAQLYASFGRSFRHPLLDELFSYYTNTVSPSLKAQRSLSWDVGTRFKLTEKAALVFNLFRITTDDEIFWNPTTSANENLDGETRRDGVEVRLNYRNGGWSFDTSYAYTDSKINGGVFDNKEVPNVPNHRAAANIGYRFAFGFDIGFEGVYVGNRYLISDFENAEIQQDEYIVLNARMRYEWRRMVFFVNLNNIFDKKYAEYGGVYFNMATFEQEPGFYPSPEFNILAGVSMRFGGL